MGFITNPDNSKKQVAEGITFSTKQKLAQMWPLDPMLCSSEIVAADGSGSPTALSITTAVSFVTTATNSTHVSLGDGTSIGHCKFIVHKTRNTSTLTNNYSLTFDGADDVIDVGSDATLDEIFSGGGTVMAWIKPDSDGENNLGRVFDKSDATSHADGWSVVVSNENSGSADLRFAHSFSGNNPLWDTASREITIGSWNHIAITYDNGATGNNPIIYINGISVTLASANPSPIGSATDDSSENLFIGNNTGGARAFEGNIDEVAIWDEVLDADAVSAIYNSGSPIDLTEASGDYDNEDDLIGWWRMGDGTEAGSGDTIYDMSDNDNDGTKSGSSGTNNTPQYSTTVP